MPKKICCEIEMSDFSYSLSMIGRKQSHFYCTRCGSHYFKGKNYTAEEWFYYVNGVAYSEYIKNEQNSTK